MKLKIVSDGTCVGTKFYNVETGEQIELDAEKITWTADVTGGKQIVRAEVRLILTEADLVAEDVAVYHKKFNREVDSTGDTEKLREDFGV